MNVAYEAKFFMRPPSHRFFGGENNILEVDAVMHWAFQVDLQLNKPDSESVLRAKCADR